MKINIKRWVPLFLLARCLLIPVSLLNTAQKQEKDQKIQEQAIAVNIEVPVRVYDGNKFVDDLTIKDFVIYEDGKKQDIDAVYLIKERAIERKESVEEKIEPEQEGIEKEFAPEEQRHFVFVFELLEYLPQINEVIDYFFQNVMQGSDAVRVLTPVSSYRLTPESLQTKTKGQMAEALKNIVQKDLRTGNAEYRHTIEEMKRVVRALATLLSPKGSDVETMLDDYSTSLYSSTDRQNISLVISAYQSVHDRLLNIRGIEQKKLIDLSEGLKKINGQKIVFILYQREHVPQVSDRVMLQYSTLFQDEPGLDMMLANIMAFPSGGYAMDVDAIKQAYADSSISAHFLFLTKLAERHSFIDMQEFSSDVFNAFKTLADATGGTVDSSSSPEHLFKKAVEATENYYLLYYTPKNYVADGKFKKIEVKVKSKKYKVTHRAGYIAD
jgi:VWFA-related protein